MSATQTVRQLCSLEEAQGRVAVCPREECPFWDDDGGCEVERLALHAAAAENPQLARWLLSVRARLTPPALLHELLPPGVRD